MLTCFLVANGWLALSCVLNEDRGRASNAAFAMAVTYMVVGACIAIVEKLS